MKASRSRSRLRFVDLIGESVSAVVARPGRAAFTMVGTVLGVGTLVTILCLTATIQGQVSARFNVLTATKVIVKDDRQTEDQLFPFSAEAEARVQHLNGVLHEGAAWNVQSGKLAISATDPDHGLSPAPTVTAVTPGLWQALDAHVSEGRAFDQFAEDKGANVAMLGRVAAKQLGISDVAAAPAIFIAGQPYVVVGILDRVSEQPDLLLNVLIPSTAAIKRWGQPSTKDSATMTIATALGAAQQVAGEAQIAVAPSDQSAVTAVPPPDPKTLRLAVNSDLSTLFFVLAVVCLVIGMVGIANTTLVAVLERTGEIGLRRSLGARRRHIGMQIITESSILGGLGGLIGASLGVIATLVVSVASHWAPIVDVTVIALAPAVGVVTGILAGTYPSWMAVRIQPSEALRK